MGNFANRRLGWEFVTRKPRRKVARFIVTGAYGEVALHRMSGGGTILNPLPSPSALRITLHWDGLDVQYEYDLRN